MPRPWALVRGSPGGARFELKVTHKKKRKHLPLCKPSRAWREAVRQSFAQRLCRLCAALTASKVFIVVDFQGTIRFGDAPHRQSGSFVSFRSKSATTLGRSHPLLSGCQSALDQHTNTNTRSIRYQETIPALRNSSNHSSPTETLRRPPQRQRVGRNHPYWWPRI